MNDIERLAFVQALYNECGKMVNTKDPDSLRSQVDWEYKDKYDDTGAKSFDIEINGEQVGTYSIRFSKEKPATITPVFEVNDYVSLGNWIGDAPYETVRAFLDAHNREFAEYVFHETGELADGCNIAEIRTLPQKKEYIGGLLKVDSEKVANALKAELPPVVYGLLGGGDE